MARQRRGAPARGEWIDLEPLSAPGLPPLPGDDWSPRTLAAWKAWGMDPVTSQYGPSEVQNALDLAHLYEGWVRDGGISMAAEIRQWLDRLGLNAKGKRDLRFRLLPEAQGELVESTAFGTTPARERGLRAI